MEIAPSAVKCPSTGTEIATYGGMETLKHFFSFICVFVITTAAFSEASAGPTRRYNRSAIACGNPTTAYDCMACNCFNEAGNQSRQGQIDVGKVVMTRVGLPQYPDTVCGVVKHRYPRTRYYQFSWMNKTSTRRAVPKGHSCLDTAKVALQFRGYFADHYHATYVHPKWGKSKNRVTRTGDHIFYALHSPRRLDREDQKDAASVIASIGFDIGHEMLFAGLVD